MLVEYNWLRRILPFFKRNPIRQNGQNENSERFSKLFLSSFQLTRSIQVDLTFVLLFCMKDCSDLAFGTCRSQCNANGYRFLRRPGQPQTHPKRTTWQRSEGNVPVRLS